MKLGLFITCLALGTTISCTKSPVSSQGGSNVSTITIKPVENIDYASYHLFVKEGEVELPEVTILKADGSASQQYKKHVAHTFHVELKDAGGNIVAQTSTDEAHANACPVKNDVKFVEDEAKLNVRLCRVNSEGEVVKSEPIETAPGEEAVNKSSVEITTTIANEIKPCAAEESLSHSLEPENTKLSDIKKSISGLSEKVKEDGAEICFNLELLNKIVDKNYKCTSSVFFADATGVIPSDLEKVDEATLLKSQPEKSEHKKQIRIAKADIPANAESVELSVVCE